MTTDTLSCPVFHFDPWDREILDDPSEFYRTIREAGPISWLEGRDVVVTGRHEDVTAILADPAAFGSSGGVGYINLKAGKQTFRTPSLLLESDAPDHPPRRRAVANALSPAALRKLREDFEAEAERRVSAILAQEVFDAHADLAAPYIVKIFPDAVGLRPEGRENLLPYGNLVFNSFGPENEIFRASARNAAELTAWITQSCAPDALRPGGFGDTIYEAMRRGEISEAEAPVLVRSLLSAGLDSTVHGVVNASYCFARWPEAWQQIAADPTLIRRALDETVRMLTPVRNIFRTTNEEVDYKGVTIPRHTKVMLLAASANHDPEAWTDPDRFDIHRVPNRHLGFGGGVHGCVGQMVAKMELEILFTEMARRIERLEPAGAAEPLVHNTFQTFGRLPLRAVARGR